MSLNNQNRLKNAFSELPTHLKFRSMIESGVKTGQTDPLIVRSFDKDDFPLIKELMGKYLDLPHLYYEKLFLDQRMVVYEARECWKMQTKMTLSALKLALFYVDTLVSLNKSLNYADLERHCEERKKELTSFVIQVETLLRKVNHLLRRKPEFQLALDEIRVKIDKIEADLGFTFPFKDAFL